MSSVDVRQHARGGIELGEKRGGETQASLAVAAGVAVHIRYKISQRAWRRRQRLQAGLKCGHKQRRWDAFTGNVGDREQEVRLRIGARSEERRVGKECRS